MLLTTAINDQRVDPWQMAKMAARLQAATASVKPVLLRVDWGSGHFSASDQPFADIYSFVLWQMGVPEFQPRGHASEEDIWPYWGIATTRNGCAGPIGVTLSRTILPSTAW